MRDKGTCSRGADCKYSHHPQDTGRTKTGALTKAGKKREEDASAALKGKGKGKSKGKNQTKSKDKSKILCKHVKNDKRCPNHPTEGGNCEYNHRRKEFDEKAKYTSKKKKGDGKGRADAQEEDLGGWETPSGAYPC